MLLIRFRLFIVHISISVAKIHISHETPKQFATFLRKYAIKCGADPLTSPPHRFCCHACNAVTLSQSRNAKFHDTIKAPLLPPFDRKFVPCPGKICALPRKIFFLLIVAKMPLSPPSQKHKNIFTLHPNQQPTDRLRIMSARTPHNPIFYSFLYKTAK